MLVTVAVSGVDHQISEGTTIGDLLREKGVQATKVVVELNRQIVARDKLDSTPIHGGDVIEVVRFVGGG